MGLALCSGRLFGELVSDRTKDGRIRDGAIVDGHATYDGHRVQQPAVLYLFDDLAVVRLYVSVLDVAIQDVGCIAEPLRHFLTDDGRDLLRRPGWPSTAAGARGLRGEVEHLYSYRCVFHHAPSLRQTYGAAGTYTNTHAAATAEIFNQCISVRPRIGTTFDGLYRTCGAYAPGRASGRTVTGRVVDSNLHHHILFSNP